MLRTNMVLYAGALVLVGAVVVPERAVRAHQAPAARTAADGVYTAAQAKRGSDIYDQECVTCHGATMAGGESGPALIGDEFIKHWSDQSVGDLFDVTRNEMPKDSPGRLSRAQYVDLIAHVLSANEFPAGETDLQANADLLKAIRVGTPKRR